MDAEGSVPEGDGTRVAAAACDSFEVEVDPGVALPKLTILGASSPAEPTFCLRSFTPRSGYAAAIALDREIDAVEFFDWTNADAAMPLEQDRRRDSPAV